MVVILKLTILTVIIVLGLRVSLSNGMIFQKLGKFFERKVEEGYLWMDVFICPWCMGSLQCATAHFVSFKLGLIDFEWDEKLVFRYLIIVLASSFVSGVLWTIYLTLNQIKEKNEAEAEYLKSVTHSE